MMYLHFNILSAICKSKGMLLYSLYTVMKKCDSPWENMVERNRLVIVVDDCQLI